VNKTRPLPRRKRFFQPFPAPPLLRSLPSRLRWLPGCSRTDRPDYDGLER
jgi:hypothetical protein